MRYWFDTEFIEDGKTIELISIGIISEDNREYYAISSDFEEYKSCKWVKENVLVHLDDNIVRRTKLEIKQEVIKFIGSKKAEFWVYNGAYDWVVFCQLFGHIRDLPKNFPWYANDIKQFWYMLDRPKLPSQLTLKHHALNDAKWNKLAWEFLQNIWQNL